jgi:hypothetical protein
MLITLSVVMAVVCCVGAIVSYVSIRDIRFRSGRAYYENEYGQLMYMVKHGKLKFALGGLILVVCVCGLFASSGYFLREIGLSLFTIEKLGGLIACMIGGSYFWNAAERRRPPIMPGLTLAEATRQGMFLIGMLGKGAAWLMLYWLTVEWKTWVGAVCGIGGIMWALLNLRKRT